MACSKRHLFHLSQERVVSRDQEGSLVQINRRSVAGLNHPARVDSEVRFSSEMGKFLPICVDMFQRQSSFYIKFNVISVLICKNQARVLHY
jgi:hypothetical protein